MLLVYVSLSLLAAFLYSMLVTPLLGVFFLAGIALLIHLYRVGRRRRVHASYVVTGDRVRGPEFPPEGISITKIEHVRNAQYAPRLGSFVFFLKDGRRTRVYCANLVDPDAFLEALARVGIVHRSHESPEQSLPGVKG